MLLGRDQVVDVGSAGLYSFSTHPSLTIRCGRPEESVITTMSRWTDWPRDRVPRSFRERLIVVDVLDVVDLDAVLLGELIERRMALVLATSM